MTLGDVVAATATSSSGAVLNAATLIGSGAAVVAAFLAAATLAVMIAQQRNSEVPLFGATASRASAGEQGQILEGWWISLSIERACEVDWRIVSVEVLSPWGAGIATTDYAIDHQLFSSCQDVDWRLAKPSYGGQFVVAYRLQASNRFTHRALKSGAARLRFHLKHPTGRRRRVTVAVTTI